MANHGWAEAPAIPLRVRLGVVLRSAWLQASLNYEGMQNLGCLFCLVPVALWLKLDRQEWRAFVRRHLGLFNSNPFISPLGLGALARLEADHHRGARPLAEDTIERFSARLSAPLGAVGDSLFWAAVRPQMVLLGSLVALLAGGWGLAVLLVGFAAWQWTYRWLTFSWGWTLGTQVGVMLRDWRLRRPAQIAGLIAATCAGALVVVLFLRGYARVTGTAPDWRSSAVFIVAAIGAGVLGYGRRHATWALLGGMGLGIVASIVLLLLGR